MNMWAAAVHVQTHGCRGATAKGGAQGGKGAWEQGRMKEPITREEAKRAGKKGGGRKMSVCASRLKKAPPT